MTPEESLSLERAYYLPPDGSPSEQFWRDKAQSRETYADLCQRGSTLLANQIIEGIRSGHTPTVKQLYKTAARVRRAIAWLNQEGKEDFLLYGQPVAGDEHQSIEDQISLVVRGFDHHYHAADARFCNMLSLAAFEEIMRHKMGGQFDLKITKDTPLHEEMDVVHNASGIKVASLLHDRPSYTFLLQHAEVKDHPALFAMAQEPLNRILARDHPDAEQFCRDLGELSLDLFHIGPLRLGSQTATQMVLAGVTKAAGYEVAPRQVETDHFIEAELTPYQEYVDNYGKGFVPPPRFAGRPDWPIPVDDAFIGKAYAKMRAHYASTRNPCERLSRYINECWDVNHPKITVTALEVAGDRLNAKVHSWQQDHIDYALDFVGQADLIAMLGLPQGKFTAGPGLRVAPKNEAWAQR